jgi:predicted DNA-binding ribbon-helix-helix protein
VKFNFAFYFFEGYKSNLQVLIASVAEKRLVRNAGALRTFVRLSCPRWAKQRNLFRLNGHELPTFQSKNRARPSL